MRISNYQFIEFLEGLYDSIHLKSLEQSLVYWHCSTKVNNYYYYNRKTE